MGKKRNKGNARKKQQAMPRANPNITAARISPANLHTTEPSLISNEDKLKLFIGEIYDHAKKCFSHSWIGTAGSSALGFWFSMKITLCTADFHTMWGISAETLLLLAQWITRVAGGIGVMLSFCSLVNWIRLRKQSKRNEFIQWGVKAFREENKCVQLNPLWVLESLQYNNLDDGH